MKLLISAGWRFYFSIICLVGAIGLIAQLDIVSAIISLILAVVALLPEIMYAKSDKQALWHSWDESSVSEEQSRRLERARNGELTPVWVDTRIALASFVGGDSKKYHTSLKKCSCPDFKKRGVPCKHMYYLADQMGMIDNE